FWFNIGFKSSCTASVNADGTVSLVEGSTDIGGTRTSIAMQLAEALGIKAEEVKPTVGDTDMIGYTDVTGRSRAPSATGYAAQDAGTAIHPSYVEGQMQGGVVQGIGWALNEEYVYNAKGEMTNASFLDYRMPTSLDLPMIDTVIVEVPNPSHPYGVRGVGEVPIVPPPAAIANAIYRAVGVRMRELPMSPPRVLREILKKG